MSNGKAAASAAGRADGYRVGREDGLRMGACQAALQRTPPAAVAVRQLRVLFIPQGFHSIDHGIACGLRQAVAEYHMGQAADMVRLAEQLRPDLVLVMNGLHVFPAEHAAHVDRVRSMGIRTAIWFADDPYYTDMSFALAPHYDYVFTHEQSCVAYYRELGCSQAHYLPLAYGPETFRPMRVGPAYHSDVCFIGSAFPNRLELVDGVAPFLAGKRVVFAGGLWERLRHYKLLKRSIKPGFMPPDEVVKYYNGAKIVINVHRPAVEPVFNRNSRGLPGFSINPRTYEMSGCGTLQLTDIRHDLYQHYKPGHEIETFESPNELTDKIRYYLDHEEHRRTIAVNGLRRSLRDHTFARRLSEMLGIIYG